MPGPTDLEQLFLEYVNAARLDPLGDATRYISSYSAVATSPNADIQTALTYFGVSGTALLSAYNGLVPVGPLAWNDMLGSAAQTHSAAMIAAGQQTHQAPGEASLGTRVSATGYTSPCWERTSTPIRKRPCTAMPASWSIGAMGPTGCSRPQDTAST